MRVLIFEPAFSGHHAPYLRHLLRALAELGQESLVITSRGNLELPEFRIHLADEIEKTTIEASLEFPAKQSLPQRGKLLLIEMNQAIRMHQPDQVWVPYADHMTQMLGLQATTLRPMRWPSSIEIEALFFRGGFAYPSESLSKKISRRLSRYLISKANWDRLHILDPIPYDQLKQAGGKLSKRLHLMPDPVEAEQLIDKKTARESLGIETLGKYLGCIGGLNEGKGTHLVLNAFSKARMDPSCKLLLAGFISPSVRSLITERFTSNGMQSRITMIDRHLTAEELNLAVQACDVVCTPYPSHIGSASFVLRGAAANRPILGSTFGWIGWAIPTFQLGTTCNVLDEMEFANAIRTALEVEQPHELSEKAKRFMRYHSIENFQAHWTARLRERLGLPGSQHLYPWEQVFVEEVS